jgi:hypothetical protein
MRLAKTELKEDDQAKKPLQSFVWSIYRSAIWPSIGSYATLLIAYVVE